MINPHQGASVMSSLEEEQCWLIAADANLGFLFLLYSTVNMIHLLYLNISKGGKIVVNKM